MKKPVLETEMTRRGFVGAVGGLLVSSALPAESAASTAAGKKLGRIGLQLYTVRDEMQKNFARTLARVARRSEEHTSELQSQSNLVCRLLLEKKKKKKKQK